MNKLNELKNKATKCNFVEIYDIRTNDTIIRFVDNKRSSVEKQVIKALEHFGFRLFIQGSIKPNERNLYWLASNEDYKGLHLSFKEKIIDKKDVKFDRKGYSYTCFNKNLKQLEKKKDYER